jgi:hypothetical protein
MQPFETTRKTELQSMVREIIEKGSEVMTDSWRSYEQFVFLFFRARYRFSFRLDSLCLPSPTRAAPLPCC